jgi:hypothetical protein
MGRMLLGRSVYAFQSETDLEDKAKSSHHYIEDVIRGHKRVDNPTPSTHSTVMSHPQRMYPSISTPRGVQNSVISRDLLFENLRPAPTPPRIRTKDDRQTARISTGNNLTAGEDADRRLNSSTGIQRMESLNGKGSAISTTIARR